VRTPWSRPTPRTLKPNDSDGPLGATGTTPRNADLVKEGAGNLYLTGEIIAGPHGGADNEPNTQRALITVNSGRLVFGETSFTNSADSSLAINNNAHIEFLRSRCQRAVGHDLWCAWRWRHLGAEFGGGEAEQHGHHRQRLEWQCSFRKGELQTLAADQLGDDLDIIINSGAGLLVGTADTVGNIFMQKGGALETGVNTRIDDGDENPQRLHHRLR